jgi:hypothetical protein
MMAAEATARQNVNMKKELLVLLVLLFLLVLLVLLVLLLERVLHETCHYFIL